MTDRPKVSFATVYPNEVPVSYMNSWTNFLMFDATNWGVVVNDHGLISVRYGTDGLVAARNTVVEQFLATENDWLLWVDADMGFDPMSVYRLLAVADPEKLPIVGGLCFASREYAIDGLNGYRTKPSPTIFHMTKVDGHETVSGGQMYPVNSVVRCAATGSAFILIHRTVFEKLGSGFYDRMPNPTGKGNYGEDVSFCLRAQEAGFPVHVFTGARTSHFKPQWVQEADYWSAMVPPPATEEVAVIVPVMKRPWNAKPFMDSLKASTGRANVYAVCDADDKLTMEAWNLAGAKVVVTLPKGRAGTFAEKANIGYRESTEPWLFLVGDDVRFYPGWLDHAQHVAKTFKKSVIGTNDLGNPRVLLGDHATHMMIRRSYVDAVGSSWDGPEVVAHEGYRHWYVDDEIVSAAKQREEWSMALGSIVEHLHPMWDKSEDDETYQLGQSFVDQDRKEFEKRCKIYQ